MIAFFALAPLVAYPVFLMKVIVLRASRLRLQPPDRLRAASCPSGTRCFSAPPGMPRARGQGVGFSAEFAILFGTRVFRLARPGHRAPRDPAAGIYFAMITLALAQMVYFFYLQAPFTGGEDGIPGRAARQALRRARPEQRVGDVFAGFADVSSADFFSSTAPCIRRSGRY